MVTRLTGTMTPALHAALSPQQPPPADKAEASLLIPLLFLTQALPLALSRLVPVRASGRPAVSQGPQCLSGRPLLAATSLVHSDPWACACLPVLTWTTCTGASLGCRSASQATWVEAAPTSSQ